ncbi:MAG: DUF1778 domain-containing protein [Opitutaceae bacterium]|jgi:uncharacterized protein (DUF1778 family)
MVKSNASELARRLPRNSRLVARISREDKDVIARAAAFKGESVANFVIGEARAAAVKLLGEQNEIRLNAEESRRLVAALLAPARPPTRAFKEALKVFRGTVASDVNPKAARP